jgi:hypothetical protein
MTNWARFLIYRLDVVTTHIESALYLDVLPWPRVGT